MLLRVDNAICRVGVMHSENAQTTQLLFYCSGGDRSVKCVRPALKMESFKEEQRGVVRSWWLTVLEHAIKPKRPGKLSDGIILLHDNARHHTANPVRDKLQIFGWETVEHPPYSLDFFSSYFHTFCDLKKDVRGRLFHWDEEVQKWVRLWNHQRPTSFYKTGIDRLISQWINVLTFQAITFE